MKKRAWLLTASLCMALLAGCGAQKVTPVAINEDVDKCDVCNMQVKDDHNATEIVLKDGKALKFDDIGDLYVWKKKNGNDQIKMAFVRDYSTKEWIELDKASFVYDKMFKTPMAYGVYSFKDKDTAQAFVNEQGKGKLMAYSDLENHTWERNKDMMQQMMEMHKNNMGGGTQQQPQMQMQQQQQSQEMKGMH